MATLAVLAASLAAGSESAGALTGLRQESSGRLFRLVVDLDHHPAEYVYHSPEPSLVLLDFPGVARGRLPERLDPTRREVASIRLLPLTGGRNGVRLEVRLAAFLPHRVAAEGGRVALTLEPPEVPAPSSALRPPSPAAPATPAAPLAAARTPGSRIVRLTWWDRGGTKDLVVGTDGPVRYRDFVLANPDRLVVDFPGASFAAGARPPAVDGAFVRRVRVGRYGEGADGVARLVVDLSGPTPYRILATDAGLTITFGPGR